MSNDKITKDNINELLDAAVEQAREYGLNPSLVRRQLLIPDDIMKLGMLHDQKDQLFDLAEILDPNDEDVDIKTLKHLVQMLVHLEFAMQSAWKFAESDEYHTWWFKMPHCKCPKMDNSDMMFPGRIISGDCKLHNG